MEIVIGLTKNRFLEGNEQAWRSPVVNENRSKSGCPAEDGGGP
jgi:hypothetical protein